MIVVSANWLISDGSLSPPPRAATIGDFLRTIGRLACRSGVQPDGSYRPIGRVDLVLAGDAFDGLTSRLWLGRNRPWQGGRATREIVDRIAVRCVQAGRRSLGLLRGLVKRGLEVPVADFRRRPNLARTATIPVSLTLLSGDRDGLLEQSTPWREVVRPGIAIASSWERTMPSGETVVVRHGHEFDPLCFGGRDDAEPAAREEVRRCGRPPTLAESLCVDLLASYAWGLAGMAVPQAVRSRIVRALVTSPMMDVPRVLSRRIVGGDFPSAVTVVLADAWKRSVDRWHEAARAEPPISSDGFDAVDALASWMRSIDRHDAAAAATLLDMRSLGLPSGAVGAGRRVRLVLGHPPTDLPLAVVGGGRSGAGVDPITIGLSQGDGGRDGGPSVSLGRGPVTEVAAGRRDDGDEPAWVAVSERSRPVVSPGLVREAA